MREKLDHFVIPELGQLDIEVIIRSDWASPLSVRAESKCVTGPLAGAVSMG
jgi:hypothetical protein